MKNLTMAPTIAIINMMVLMTITVAMMINMTMMLKMPDMTLMTTSITVMMPKTTVRITDMDGDDDKQDSDD